MSMDNAPLTLVELLRQVADVSDLELVEHLLIRLLR
jgi:hypothetical protein